MKIIFYSELPKDQETCCTKTDVRQLTDAEDFDIKLFEMQPGGFSPLHSHPAQHRAIFLDGEGIVSDGKNAKPIRSGEVVFVSANEPHQFKTTGGKPLRFLIATFSNKE